MTELKASIIIRAIDRATAPMRRVTKNFANMRRSWEQSNKMFQRAANMRQAAEGVRTFSRAVTGAIQNPISSFEEFQSTMSSVKAVSADITENEFAAMTAQAERLGSTTRWTATQSAQAMKYFSIAGFDAAKTMEAVPVALDLATAAGMDLGRSADIVSDLMGAMGVSMKGLPEFANQLTRTFTGANVTLETLFESLIYSGPVARQMGIMNKDLLAMTGLLGGVGIKGSMAGTAMRTMIARLTAGRRRGQKTLEALNVEISDMSGNMRPLPDILADILSKTSKMGTAKRAKAFKYIFGTEAMTAASALATMGRKDILEFADQVEKGSKTVQDVARIMDENARGASIRLSSAIEGLSNTLGKSLEPTLTRIKEILTDVVARINKFSTEHPGLTRAIMITVGAVAVLSTGLAGFIFTLAAATTALGVMNLAMGGSQTGAQLMGSAIKWVSSGITKALPSLVIWNSSWWSSAIAINSALWPILAIVAAIAGIVLVIKYWDKLVAIWERFKNASIATKAVLVTLAAPFIAMFAPILAVANLIKQITAGAGSMKEVFSDIWDVLVWPLEQVVSLLEKVDAVVSKISIPAPLKSFLEMPAKLLAAPLPHVGSAATAVAGAATRIGREAAYVATGNQQVLEAGDLGGTAQQVGGKIVVQVESDVPARVASVSQRGPVGIEADTGYMAGLPY